MGSLLEIAAQCFTEEGWPFEYEEGQPMLHTVYEGLNGRWGFYAAAKEEAAQLAFYSLLSHDAPPNRRADLAEFLSRANFGLMIGNFEINFLDGQVRFKTSLDFESTPPVTALLRPLLYLNVNTFNHYLPGLEKVIAGDSTPEQAIQAIESGSSASTSPAQPTP